MRKPAPLGKDGGASPFSWTIKGRTMETRNLVTPITEIVAYKAEELQPGWLVKDKDFDIGIVTDTRAVVRLSDGLLMATTEVYEPYIRLMKVTVMAG
jgi:hypothetical protein